MTKHTQQSNFYTACIYFCLFLCAQKTKAVAYDGTNKRALELGGQNAKQAGEFGVKSKSGRLKMKNGFLF
jgi:hypothetical protein